MDIDNLLPRFIYNSQRVTLNQKAMCEFLAAFDEISVVWAYFLQRRNFIEFIECFRWIGWLLL